MRSRSQLAEQALGVAEGIYSRIVGKQRAEVDFFLLHNRMDDWQYRRNGSAVKLPQECVSYLSNRNPRLKELIQRYAAVQGLEHSIWRERVTEAVRLQKFRGEGDYLSQMVSSALLSYAASFGYGLALDDTGLFDLFSEDSLFGCHTYNILGKCVSRDLLDSVLEIQFLTETLGLSAESSTRVLDIGAGYGRFAHRLTTVFPGIKVKCTDGVPISTFLAEFYLKFRNVSGAAVLPLDEVETFSEPLDIACNIHSWSECTLQSIRWWLDRLDVLRPRYLFVVPHTEAGLACEADSTRPSFLPEITGRGWKLKEKRAKFYKNSLLMQTGVFPAWYFLYER